MNFKEEIAEILKKSIKKLGYSDEKLVVSFSNKPEICDFQTNFALICAKDYGKKPIDFANEIVGGIEANEDFEFSAVMPGFLNVKVTEKGLSNYANFVSGNKFLGIEQEKTAKLIMFDYGGANVAKELHVGHLRSPIVGEALKRLNIAIGNKTISDAHLGDYGLQMGLTILQLKKDGYLDNFFDGTKNPKIKNVTLDLLNEEYPKASKTKETDKNFKSEAEKITLDIQRHIGPYFEIYKQIKP